MDKRTRAYKIYDAGIQALDPLEVPDNKALLLAVAAMIDFATKKPEKKKANYDKLLYNEQDVLATLNYDLEVTRHNMLNRQLKTMVLKDGDLDKFKTWFENSMYPWMKKNGVELTFSMLTRKYPEWLERARHYSGSGYETVASEGWR